MNPGVALLDHVWNHHHGASWDAINHSMSNALRLAIGSRMEFKASDIKHIETHYKPSYWLGEFYFEYSYALAVSAGNTSFISALEECLGRKPFWGNQVTPVSSEGYTHRTSERVRERLTLGSRLGIDGQPGMITSINNERAIVTLRECGEKHPRRIIKLTHEKCSEIWPAPKKKKKTKQAEEDAR